MWITNTNVIRPIATKINKEENNMKEQIKVLEKKNPQDSRHKPKNIKH